MSNPEYQREYRARHRESHLAYHREWMRERRAWEKAHPGQPRPRRERRLNPERIYTGAAIREANRDIDRIQRLIDRLPRWLTEEQKQRVQNLSTELWRRAAP
jgi:hypothetical protein